MKLFRKKSSPKEGNSQRRSSRGGFDGRRRSSSSSTEIKQHLLESAEKGSEVLSASTSPSSMNSQSQGDIHRAHAPTPDHKTKDMQSASAANCDINVDTMKNEEKYEIMKVSESLDAAHESAKNVKTEHTTEIVVQIGSPKVAFASEVETREDPPGDQNYQYGVNQEDSAKTTDGISEEVSKQTAPTPRKPVKTSKIMNFLRKGSPRHKMTPTKKEKTDPLNTTIETAPSSDSDDPAASPTSSPRVESRDSGDSTKEGRTHESTEKKAPIRTGPMEISNINLSRLIKHKNAAKKQPQPSVFKPLKANRSRPPTMSMSKRNEEQFQRYIQRQNRGRKVRENQFVPSFH
mmetsp:Transcript_14019/g.33906  ORF Transcript_14019/g.33906 Transcript_14019/m.33906 type:complete len:347 (+) Transcript_14019:119-1159(+)